MPTKSQPQQLQSENRYWKRNDENGARLKGDVAAKAKSHSHEQAIAACAD
jgi:hypothetical protein